MTTISKVKLEPHHCGDEVCNCHYVIVRVDGMPTWTSSYYSEPYLDEPIIWADIVEEVQYYLKTLGINIKLNGNEYWDWDDILEEHIKNNQIEPTDKPNMDSLEHTPLPFGPHSGVSYE